MVVIKDDDEDVMGVIPVHEHVSGTLSHTAAGFALHSRLCTLAT